MFVIINQTLFHPIYIILEPLEKVAWNSWFTLLVEALCKTLSNDLVTPLS
jgi:hypothetical protein